MGPGDPAAKVALEVRLLPLVGADIDLVTAGQMEPLVRGGLLVGCGQHAA